MQVVMKKNELLAVLEKNRLEHVQIFEEASAGYLVKVTAALEVVKKEFEDTKVLNTRPLNLAKPASYEKEYLEAIEMTKLTEEQLITLPQNEFRQYVLDKWNWMGQFGAASFAYVGESTTTALNSKLA